MASIEDGTGKGYGLKVDSRNRAHVESIQESLSDYHSFLGKKFNINSGDINVTSSDTHALVYFKNNEDNDVIVESFIYLIGSQVGGTGTAKFDILRNPTSGTIVSDAITASLNANMNFGSAEVLNANVYIANTSTRTMTGGTQAISSLINQASPSRAVISIGKTIIRKGNSIGVRVQCADGTTALKVQIAMPCYVDQVGV